MARIAATLCFALTLLCPLVCLADETGGCADHERAAGRNCEAMSAGALVAEAQPGASALASWPPALDGFLPGGVPSPGSGRGWPFVSRDRASAKPPPAASTRQALLQTFLF